MKIWKIIIAISNPCFSLSKQLSYKKRKAREVARCGDLIRFTIK
jgi:hypothetical protein